MRYYTRHIGDYAQATSHLSFVEDAAYSRLIRRYYADEKPLPADVQVVQRLIGARTEEERQAVVDVLEEFFFLEADGWHNSMCDAEIKKRRDKQAKARASAEARWSKRNANAMRTHTDRNADALRTQCERNANASNIDANALRTHAGTDANASDIDANASLTRTHARARSATVIYTSTAAYKNKEIPSSSGGINGVVIPNIGSNANSVGIPNGGIGSNASSVGAASSPAAAAIQARTIELAALLQQRGVNLRLPDSRVSGWATDGFTDAQLLAALDTAQQRRRDQGNPQPINAGYLDAILRAAPKPNSQQPNPRRSIHDKRADIIAGLTGQNRQPAESGRIIDITPTPTDRVD